VSRGIIELGLRRDRYFETYHLTNPDTRTYSQVIAGIADLGYRIHVVSQDEYRRMLFKRELVVDGVEYKSATTQAFRWWYKRDIDFSHSAVTNCDYTLAQLKPLGIVCPKVDSALLGRYFKRAPSGASGAGTRRAGARRAFADTGETAAAADTAALKEEVPI
jgi:hypothetical protein